MTKLTRRYRFSASHRLHAQSLSLVENQRLFGKCNNTYGHGHDYVLDVSVTGKLNAATGLMLSIAELDRMIGSEILAGFSYRNLNSDVAEFDGLVPTTENLALVIAARLQACWSRYLAGSAARLAGVTMQETDRNSVAVVVGSHESGMVDA